MQISLDGWACLLGALLLLILPFSWLMAAVFAALFHEVCHLFALILTGTKIWGIRIGISGAQIKTAPMPPKSEFLCALAGPLGSFFLLLFVRYIPRIALCAAVQGLFNLLPLFPLDGGRILRSLAAMLLPENTADTLSSTIETSALFTIGIFACLLFFRFGLFPVILAGMVVSRTLQRKIPCKEAKLGVQ